MDEAGPSGRAWQPSTPTEEGHWKADFLRAAPELEQLSRCLIVLQRLILLSQLLSYCLIL